ncbi:hydantoinase/oxoprolinase family protein [Castellaniella sp. GW247-6E4]|uniref:hydantoinase/oxoprolinase family protein n=1 Tax=Castellaniella sp. GW247-6E4 TaxID=3140380 RepID=UPI003315B238
MADRTYLIAADTGGTFTDVVAFDSSSGQISYGKALTNYSNLADGALEGLESAAVDLSHGLLFKHGTTHVINAFIQRNGAKTALVTTKGFSDLLEIGRGNRPVPFSLRYRRDPVLVARDLRFDVEERIDAKGEIVVALNEAELETLARRLEALGIEAVAVAFLNAYLNSAHEQRAVEILQERLPRAYVTSGSALSREWYEYERTSTAAANAYVGPKMRHYVDMFDARLKQRAFGGTFYMMGSNGGVLSTERSVKEPIALVESGPVGGCIGAARYAAELGIENVIAFDMGGTTAKCALVMNAQFDVQPLYYVGGYDHGFPLRTPVVDIVEVGAGGGSIAHIDPGGDFVVGPQSAGSEPGPVAFGRGGVEPTITDANLVLGRIGAGKFMSGRLSLDVDQARHAIRTNIAEPLGHGDADGVDTAAQGVLDLANIAMTNAIKEISIERGYDVREFALFVFGGSGPLFGCQLARALKIPRVIVPPHPGNFSCLGMLLAPIRVDLARTVVGAVSEDTLREAEAIFEALEDEARVTLERECKSGTMNSERSLEMRYRGQKHSVQVRIDRESAVETIVQKFDEIYSARYGHVNADCAIEIVGARLFMEGDVARPGLEALGGGGMNVGATQPVPSSRRSVYFPRPFSRVETDVWDRASLPVGFKIVGPAIIEEYSSTTVILPGDIAEVGKLGEISISCDLS